MRTWDTAASTSRGPSREEIESLCILHAIGARGCRGSELATRLGLSPALAGLVSESIGPLVSAGWVEQEEERISRTDRGSRWLKQRLSDWSVRG